MSRLCTDCGQPLSRYTTGDICGPCITAARDVPRRSVELPLGFWFSEPIRAALAVWDWTTVLQSVYQQTHATQTAMASQTGLSQTTVSRLMAGRSGGQTIETALKLLDGLGIPRQLAGLMPKGLGHLVGGAGNHASVQTGKDGGVKRRDFGQKVLLAGLSISLVGSAPSKPAGAAVDIVRELDRPADVVADLWALDAIYGGAALADLAEARLTSVVRQLKHVTLKPSEEPFVQAVLGHIAVAGAWFCYEGGDLSRAERLLKDALYSAHEAGDPALRLLVINNMAMTAYALGDSAKTAAMSFDALESAPRADSQLKALLAMRSALGHAGTDNQREYEKMRGLAWDHLGRASGAPRDEWFKFFGEQEMHGLNAVGESLLGHHETPATLEIGVLEAMAPRNRAYYEVIRAASLVKAGEHTNGIDAFHNSLPLLLEVTSNRIADKVRDLATALRTVPGDDAAETRRIAISLTGGTHA